MQARARELMGSLHLFLLLIFIMLCGFLKVKTKKATIRDARKICHVHFHSLYLAIDSIYVRRVFTVFSSGRLVGWFVGWLVCANGVHGGEPKKFE